MTKNLGLLFNRKSQSENSQLKLFLRSQFGLRTKNLDLYAKAFRHKSVAKKLKSGIKDSNERLEFLGDSVIATVVSEYLYEKFPNKDEGFLTQMRSKIVSRKNLNAIGKKLGLETHAAYLKGNFPYKSLLGNVFEALLGAMYLDKGYKKTKEIFIVKILEKYVDLDYIEANNIDFKSKLLIHCQKNKLELQFKTIEETVIDGSIHFKMGVYITGELKGISTALSKRNAEQLAAEIVFRSINE